MTAPAYRAAVRRVEHHYATIPPRRGAPREPLRPDIPNDEVVARLKADPMFECFCCRMAGRLKATTGVIVPAVEIAKVGYGYSDRRLV